jgi:hypothetical protein
MNDTGQRMAALAGKFEAPLLVTVEGSPEGDEVLHATRTFLDKDPHCIDVAEPITGGKGVGQMEIGRIRIAAQHRGNAALRPSGGGLFECTLCEDSDTEPVSIGGPNRGGETGDAGAHNEEIEFSGLDHSSPVLRALAADVAPCGYSVPLSGTASDLVSRDRCRFEFINQLVVCIDVHNDRHVGIQFGVLVIGIRDDDDPITRLDQPGSSTVQANLTRSAGDRVRLEPCSVVDIDNMDLFPFANVR